MSRWTLFQEKMRDKSTVGILNKYEFGSFRLNTKITDENSVKYISAGQEWFQTYSYIRIPRPLLSSTTN